MRIIAPFPAGGGTDFSRAPSHRNWAVRCRAAIVTDNRSGAGGMIGSDMVARAAPDGYTLLVTSSSTHVIAPHLTRKPLYDPFKDFSPVIADRIRPQCSGCSSFGAGTLGQTVGGTRQGAAGELNFASNGSGTLSHLTGELFKIQTGINLVHIPYKGGPPAVIDLMAGQVLGAIHRHSYRRHASACGPLRAIAVTGLKLVDAIKEVPTVAETVPGFESSQWWGMFAPAGNAAGNHRQTERRGRAYAGRGRAQSAVRRTKARIRSAAVRANLPRISKPITRSGARSVKEAGIRPE